METNVPAAGDDVFITNARARVLLTNSTANLSSLTLAGGSAFTNMLVFSNWDTVLTATNVTILTNGTMTLPAAFTDSQQSNNIYVICSNLTIAAGGRVFTDGSGYAGAIASGGSGNGPGKGTYYSGGGGYGGGGGRIAVWFDVRNAPALVERMSKGPMIGARQATNPPSSFTGTASVAGGSGLNYGTNGTVLFIQAPPLGTIFTFH